MANNSINERYQNWLPKSKTAFPLNKVVKTTFNLGQLTPMSFFEGLPSETFNFSAQSLVRFPSPFIKPALESFKFHYSCFVIPLRILQDSFKKVMGERDDYDSKTDNDYKLGALEFIKPNGDPIHMGAKNIMSYLNIPLPTKADKDKKRKIRNINKMLANAYALVWNEHFRDPNLQQAKDIDKTDGNILAIAETDPDSYFHTSAPDKYTGRLANVNRDFDYFSNVFQDTQKGEQLTINLGDKAIIKGSFDGTGRGGLLFVDNKQQTEIAQGSLTLGNADAIPVGAKGPIIADDPVNSIQFPVGINFDNNTDVYADLSNASPFTINKLREVEKLQQRRELDLVSGVRYYEMLQSYFNVKNALAQLDYPVQVAYSQGMLEIQQIVQTSAEFQNNSTPQGNVAGYSVNVNSQGIANFTLNEHSIIIPMVYVTQEHTYQQGVARFHNRFIKDDFFDPTQIGQGFRPIYKSEIYGYATDQEKDDIWAYAPANERYRKSINVVSGMLNSNSSSDPANPQFDNLSAWHAGDIYDNPPIYDANWKLETPKFLDRILAYGSDIVDNFLLEFQINGIKISPLDPLGVPFL